MCLFDCIVMPINGADCFPVVEAASGLIQERFDPEEPWGVLKEARFVRGGTSPKTSVFFLR
jgi:hypothetical protein